MRRLATALIVVLALTGCSSNGNTSKDVPTKAPSSTSSPTIPSEPMTEAAVKKLAQEENSRFSAKDYAGAWDLYSKAGKAALSQDDYVRYNEACDTGGMPIEVKDVRMESDIKATVRIGIGDIEVANKVLYEEDKWRWQPRPDTMKSYATGVDQMIKDSKAAGSCG